MKQIFRNLKYIFRRFKTAFILNILGLSVAFVAFIIIMMQVEYDVNFDGAIKDVERICRIDIAFNDTRQAITSRPMAELIFKQPQVEAGAICYIEITKELIVIENHLTRTSFLEDKREVSPSFTDVFKFDIVEGSRNALLHPRQVLVPLSMAKKMFGVQSAIGKQLLCESDTLEIGGVFKDFPKNSSVKNLIYQSIGDKEKNSWGNSNYYAYVKLVSNDLENDLEKNGYKAILDARDKNLYIYNNFELIINPLKELHFTSGVKYDYSETTTITSVIILLTIAIVIIIIALVNYTNFSMAIIPMRIKSINTQQLLGCSRIKLRINLLTEAIFMGILAFVIALVLVYLASHSFIGTLIDAEIDISYHFEIFIITGMIALVASIIVGIYPSYYITSFPLIMAVKGAFNRPIKGLKLSNILIGFQFIASLILIIAAIFIYMQNKYIYSIPLGFDKNRVIVSEIGKKLSKNKEVLTKALKNNANIDDVAYSWQIISTANTYMGWERMYEGKNIDFQCIPVSANFLDVMNIKIIEGRSFSEPDEKVIYGKFIFNDTARKRYSLVLNNRVDSSEIIGFIEDIQYQTLTLKPQPMAFLLWENWSKDLSNYAYIKVKSGSNMFAAMEEVKKALKELDPDYPYSPRFYDEVLNKVYEKEAKTGLLLTLFSGIAILISVIGVFGLVMFECEHRRKEVSIRKVLGSSESDILYLFNKTYLIIIAICFVIACPIAYYAVDKWLENFAYHTPIYWWVFLIAGIIVLAITIATVSLQSWRTANRNPVDALKNE